MTRELLAILAIHKHIIQLMYCHAVLSNSKDGCGRDIDDSKLISESVTFANTYVNQTNLVDDLANISSLHDER